ncbi:hypothetical protein P43SY_003768 [Pythium insidiosum]|uniref:Uncharacterized protein n=1 Tax=Pythium insidiosum TaxID=114742 RepID=A0AAD5Q1Y4_PYTIN|nr:hypothetical protein P43SY_003768 [Pythium insidiosum]
MMAAPESPLPAAIPSPRVGGLSAAGGGVATAPDAIDTNPCVNVSGGKRSHGLRMWIPDTIVYGETGRAVWLYSDEDGFVQRVTEFTDKMILDKFASAGNSTTVVGDNEPVVVCKEPIVTNAKRSNGGQEQVIEGVFSYQGNLLRLLSLSELRTLLNNVSSTRGSRSFALQRFVRCKGSKAFIVRAVYEVRKPHYAWMVSNVGLMQDPIPTVSQVLQSLGQEAGLGGSPPVAPTASNIATRSSSAGSSLSETSDTTAPAPAAAAATAPTAPSATATPLVNRVCTSVQVDKACTFIKLNERGCTGVSELNRRPELAFKMTLKMINETLLRIRARLPPEKSYTFLTAALAREPPDPSLAHRLSQMHVDEARNYMLPVNLIRTVHFFAPRTPLHAKLKETSGLAPFLNEDTSIQIQLIRATEPPLHDPSIQSTTFGNHEDGSSRGHARRAALAPKVAPKSTVKTFDPRNHCVLLGATKIRMAQFRSAYVTKLDIYACMALSGEMFNIKGNIGLERIRYVDTKLITAQYRLRSYNGVYIPDASYIASDPLTSEWMDCLRASITASIAASSAGAP